MVDVGAPVTVPTTHPGIDLDLHQTGCHGDSQVSLNRWDRHPKLDRDSLLSRLDVRPVVLDQHQEELLDVPPHPSGNGRILDWIQIQGGSDSLTLVRSGSLCHWTNLSELARRTSSPLGSRLRAASLISRLVLRRVATVAPLAGLAQRTSSRLVSDR